MEEFVTLLSGSINVTATVQITMEPFCETATNCKLQLTILQMTLLKSLNHAPLNLLIRLHNTSSMVKSINSHITEPHRGLVGVSLSLRKAFVANIDNFMQYEKSGTAKTQITVDQSVKQEQYKKYV